MASCQDGRDNSKGYMQVTQKKARSRGRKGFLGFKKIKKKRENNEVKINSSKGNRKQQRAR